MSKEIKKFDTNVAKVLDLMIHSLYTNKDIFFCVTMHKPADPVNPDSQVSLASLSEMNSPWWQSALGTNNASTFSLSITCLSAFNLLKAVTAEAVLTEFPFILANLFCVISFKALLYVFYQIS